MDLSFEKKGNLMVAEFEATGAFNLHVERDSKGYIAVYQKGIAEGEYSTSASWYDNDAHKVIDIDFAAIVYPKHIKVVCRGEVSKGVVTFNG